jgi:very-short-patch-repair endonuclease
MPPRRSTPKVQHRAGQLRIELGPAEAKLWPYLRTLRANGVHFRWQHAIGPYIADFCSPRRKLIIEVDGSQHLDQEEYDSHSPAFLAANGFRVSQFWNNDVMNRIDDVMGVVLEEVEKGWGRGVRITKAGVAGPALVMEEENMKRSSPIISSPFDSYMTVAMRLPYATLTIL